MSIDLEIACPFTPSDVTRNLHFQPKNRYVPIDVDEVNTLEVLRHLLFSFRRSLPTSNIIYPTHEVEADVIPPAVFRLGHSLIFYSQAEVLVFHKPSLSR